MANDAGPPAAHFELALAGAGFVADPYPVLARLREQLPLCRQADGSVIVSRYDDVFNVLNDSAVFSSDKRVDFRPRFGDGPLFEHHTRSLVFNDPPAHTRVRKLISPFFTAQTLRRWASLILGALEPGLSAAAREAGERAVTEFKLYLRELIAHKRRHRASRDELDILWALIFGHGAHFCAGNGLARMEALVAFERLIARAPRMRRAGETLRAPRTRFRVIEHLPVMLA